MKIKNIILISVLGIILVGTSYFLVKRAINNKANMNVFQAIPEEADGVMVVNLEAFITLFFKNIGDVWEMRDEFSGDNYSEEFSQELQLSGINLTKKIVLFLTDNQINVLVPISNARKFEEYLLNLDGSLLEEIGENQYYSSAIGGFVGFNNNVCYIKQCQTNENNKAKADWTSIQNSENLKNKLSPELNRLAESKEHFSFFMKEDEMALRSPYFDHSPANETFLTFEDGLIKIKSTFSTSKPEIKNPLISGGPSLAKSDYLNFHLNIDPSVDLSYWLSDLGEKQLKRSIYQLGFEEDFINSWQGNFNMAISGIETAKDEVITYEYDDNFNKIEKKSIEEIKRLGYQMSYTGEQTELELRGLEIFGIRNGKFISDQNIQYFTSNGKKPETSLDNSAAISLDLDPGNLIQLAIDQGFLMASVLQNYTDLVQDIKLIGQSKDQTIESETIIKMSDSQKNSLIYLISALQ